MRGCSRDEGAGRGSDGSANSRARSLPGWIQRNAFEMKFDLNDYLANIQARRQASSSSEGGASYHAALETRPRLRET